MTMTFWAFHQQPDWDEERRIWTYPGGLEIEALGPDVPGTGRPGSYCLRIANVEHISENLEDLERKLFEWAKGEGYWD